MTSDYAQLRSIIYGAAPMPVNASRKAMRRNLREVAKRTEEIST
ncbi:hypothetical protein [Parafrankia sp. FMc2]